MTNPIPPSVKAKAESLFSKFDTFLHAHPKTAAIAVAVVANVIGVIFHV